MRFLADMGISPRVVDELRQNGHDAVHVAEQGLNRLVDTDILQKHVRKTAPYSLTILILANCSPPVEETYRALSSFVSEICAPQMPAATSTAFSINNPKPWIRGLC